MVPNTRRFIRSIVVVVALLLAAVPAQVRAQWPACCGNDAQYEVLRMKMSGVSFEEPQDRYLSIKERERHNVPLYNTRLNAALIDFHKHIADEHYLATNCAICRKYVKEIASYSKKLSEAMK